MSSGQTTCWSVIRGAAAGDAVEREQFARQYLPIVRRYLAARWRETALVHDVDDAAQEVFVECYRQDGALEHASQDHAGGFRAFLYGVVRNVALRTEAKRARARELQPATAFCDLQQAEDERLSQVFDREWAKAMMRRGAERQAERAANAGPEAVRRVELLRLRFQENLPIRTIAQRWGVEAAGLHREYARARAEFREALLDTLTHYGCSGEGWVESECRRLLELLA